jgi:hypothetical protein
LRALHVVLLEECAFRSEAVEVGGVDDVVAERAQAIGAELVVGDEE